MRPELIAPILPSAGGRLAGGTNPRPARYRPMADDPDWRAWLRINLTYAWRHGRLPDLENPARFTELVQSRKLFDRDPRLPALSDKVAVKSFVGERLGSEWLIPILWEGGRLPDHPPWQPPFIVKSRHGCNHRAIVRDGSEDWTAIRRIADRWVKGRYGKWLDEWLYCQIPPGLLVEPFLGPCGRLPIDYKF